MEDDLKDDDELNPDAIEEVLDDEDVLEGDELAPKKKKFLDDDVESADDIPDEEDEDNAESYDDTYDN